jgi:hypothetical protein
MAVAPLRHFSRKGCPLSLAFRAGSVAGSITQAALAPHDSFPAGTRLAWRRFEHARAYSLAGFLVVVCILVCSVLLTSPWRRNDLHPAGSCDRIVSQKRSIECPVKRRNALTGL